MSQHPVLIDLAIAAVIAVVVLIVSGGVAMAGVLALLILAVVGASFGVSRWRGRPRGARRPAAGARHRRA